MLLIVLDLGADSGLVRTVSGAIHPLIQMGHGVEFGLDALVAEGWVNIAGMDALI